MYCKYNRDNYWNNLNCNKKWKLLSFKEINQLYHKNTKTFQFLTFGDFQSLEKQRVLISSLGLQIYQIKTCVNNKIVFGS